MLDPNIYSQLRQAYAQLDRGLRPGEDRNLPPVQLAHFPIDDTRLAACLIRLGIPWRPEGAVTDCVELDAAGNEKSRHLRWWLSDASPPVEPDQPNTAHKTEELQVAWALRTRFEREYPLHPLVPMRAALDARDYWLSVIHAYKSGRAILPLEPRDEIVSDTYATTSLHAASVLKACGFSPRAFNRGFCLLAGFNNGVAAEDLLATAAMTPNPAGANPAQWMAGVLNIYGELLALIKKQPVILSEKHDDRTLLLTADAGQSAAGRKNRDRFHALM